MVMIRRLDSQNFRVWIQYRSLSHSKWSQLEIHTRWLAVMKIRVFMER